MVNGYTGNIEEEVRENEDYRRVLFTGMHTQLVLMMLQPGEEIGMETHPGTDQFIRVEAGEARATLDGEEIVLGDGDVVIIPAGVEHNVVNTADDTRLRLYTLYSPPEHPKGTVEHGKPGE